MDKITELKKLTPYVKESGYELAYFAGFDAAMELQLPVKFVEFILKNKVLYKTDDKYIYCKSWDDYKEYTPKELYDYWLENIYQPEK